MSERIECRYIDGVPEGVIVSKYTLVATLVHRDRAVEFHRLFRNLFFRREGVRNEDGHFGFDPKAYLALASDVVYELEDAGHPVPDDVRIAAENEQRTTQQHANPPPPASACGEGAEVENIVSEFGSRCTGKARLIDGRLFLDTSIALPEAQDQPSRSCVEITSSTPVLPSVAAPWRCPYEIRYSSRFWLHYTPDDALDESLRRKIKLSPNERKVIQALIDAKGGVNFRTLKDTPDGFQTYISHVKRELRKVNIPDHIHTPVDFRGVSGGGEYEIREPLAKEYPKRRKPSDSSSHSSSLSAAN